MSTDRNSAPAAVLTDPRCSPLHPVLRRLFAELERARVRWMLLRVPAVPAAPTGDVDILVTPTDAIALCDVASSLGFVVVPGWDRPPELLLACYDCDSNQWLVLDVAATTSLRIGRALIGDGATEAMLQRRQRRGGMAVPRDGDAFWLLLLHCLLEKGLIAEHYRERLLTLGHAAFDSELWPVVNRVLDARLRPQTLVALVRGQRWDTLIELAPSLAGHLRRQTPWRKRVALGRARVMAALRKPLLVRRRRGINLALLGPNGVGKSTAAANLQRSLPFESRVLYMGIWKSAIRRRGWVRSGAEIATRPLRIWTRYLRAEYHRLRGRLVIFDRYVYEALLPARPPLASLKRPYFWLLAHLVPHPSAVIVLDVPGHVAYGRKQENPPDELEDERRLYGALATHVASLEIVDAAADADTVRAQITTIVWRRLVARWGTAGRCS